MKKNTLLVSVVIRGFAYSVGEVRRERVSARPFTWLNNSRGIASNGLSLVHKCLAMHCNFLGLRDLLESAPLKILHI